MVGFSATMEQDLYIQGHTNTSTAGHVAFFGFISEMQVPTDYPKTLYMLQATDTIMYVVAAVVIYYYGGKDGRFSCYCVKQTKWILTQLGS